MHFFYLQNSVKNGTKNVKTRKNCQYLENGWKYRKILKISVQGATFRCFIRNDYWYYIDKIFFVQN